MPAPLCFFCGRAGCRLRSTAAWRIRIKPAAMPCRPGTDRPAIDESSRRRRRYRGYRRIRRKGTPRTACGLIVGRDPTAGSSMRSGRIDQIPGRKRRWPASSMRHGFGVTRARKPCGRTHINAQSGSADNAWEHSATCSSDGSSLRCRRSRTVGRAVAAQMPIRRRTGEYGDTLTHAPLFAAVARRQERTGRSARQHAPPSCMLTRRPGTPMPRPPAAGTPPSRSPPVRLWRETTPPLRQRPGFGRSQLAPLLPARIRHQSL